MSEKRCVIIGSSPDTEISVLTENIKSGDFVVCADGGYVYAQQAKIIPNLIIGDFDSSAFPQDSDCEIITLPVQKDDTDTLFCVKECLKRGFNNFVILGGTGGRFDHTFANICTLKFLAEKKLYAEIIDSKTVISVMTSGVKQLCGKKGMTFSIFPFGCESCEVTLSGFMYELNKGTLKSDFPLGVSNEITSDKAQITIYKGTAVIMLVKGQ